MKTSFIISAFMTLVLLNSCEKSNKAIIKTTTLTSQTESLLQAISFVDENTIWVSGHQATFARTLDAGKTWEVFTHFSDTLQFRDLHAIDENHLILMSAGSGKSSQILHYTVSSQKWDTAYIMPHEEGFLNTIEFWDNQTGLAFGDSFNDEMFVLKTEDGGYTWDRIDPDILPKPGKGEGGFAASGTCITTLPGGIAYIGTGANGNSQILFTSDYGTTWASSDGPLPKGELSGIFSIRMFDEKTGLVAGGDLAKPDSLLKNVAITTDGGKSWQTAKQSQTKGTFFSTDIIKTNNEHLIVAAGPSGIDYSLDMGQSWVNLDSGNYWCVRMHDSGYGLAAGKEGALLKIDIN